MIGIYKITNLINNKIYIGQSKDILKRWEDERNLYHIGNHLKSSFIKYGLKNFLFEIIEEHNDCSNLNEREKYWILFYKSYLRENGYNKIIGHGFQGLTNEWRQKLSEAKRGKSL
jgi:group I intron endonuclease